jgi:23S rRNA (uracil1939-C5)-methyltransferase
MAAGGDGIARLPDGRVVFCEGALPGEEVAVELTDLRRDFARARVVAVLSPSAARVAPPCPHVADGCGGCTWQHVLPADQAELKVSIVADALRRIGGFTDVEVRASPPGRSRVAMASYRTTLRLAVDDMGRPAFRRRHGHELVTVDSCLVSHPRLEELVRAARFPGAREVVLRVGAASGDRLAAPDRASRRATVPPGTAVGRSAAVREDVAGRRWRVSASSFFQSGPAAAAALVEAVVAASGPEPGRSIVDLYAGVGLLGGVVAARTGARALVAVESSEAATRDASANLVDLPARVVHAEVADGSWTATTDLPTPGLPTPGRPDLVIADPARSGLGPSAAATIVGMAAPIVVLVSCDPASLARDARLLAASGYRLAGVEVLDLFPGTFHADAVSRFVRSR